MISAIIFDCDGVLVDSEIIYTAVERKHLSRLGLHYDSTAYQTRFVGLADDDYINKLASDYQARGKGLFPDEYAANVKAESAARIEAELQAIDGIKPLLQRLNASTAVASSSSVGALQKKLDLTGLHQYFSPHIYSGEQVQRGKPAPDLFLLAATRLGVTPENCVVVEDSVNGVSAGVAAGMKVWGFTGGGHADAGLQDRLMAAGAQKVFSSFQDMSSAL